MKIRSLTFFPILLVFALFTGIVFAATTADGPTTQAKKKKKKSAPKTTRSSVTLYAGKTTTTRMVPASTGTRKTRRRAIVRSPWDEPTYADSTLGDNVDGEDLEVRRAAVESLGPLNGSVVISDPDTGRILAMVNQKLALSDGYQPCSTVKVPVAFAALSEGLMDRTTMMPIYGRTKMNLTTALAKSNNQY